MRVPLFLVVGVLTACNKDPVCGEGESLLNGECVEIMTSDDTDSTAFPPPDTGDTAEAPCKCDVCEEGTTDDAPYTSIQAAIDEASDGDTLTVCPGTYRELVTISAAGVSLIGAGAGQTTIDGSGDGTVLTITSGQGAETTISGFTLMDGDAYSTGGYGGVLRVSDSSPAFQDLIVDEGTATYGGAIALINSSSTLDGLTVLDGAAEQEGGGLYVSGGAPWVVHARFEANYASGAAAVYAENSAIRIENAIFFDNQSSSGTSAVHLADGQSVSISNIVVALNGTGNDKEACAVYAGTNSTLTNAAAYGNEGSGLCAAGTASHNLSYANQEDDFRINGMAEPGEGDLTDDPQFVDPNLGDFTIRTSSPMIDAGNPDAAYNDADGSRSDMGAYGGPYGSW